MFRTFKELPKNDKALFLKLIVFIFRGILSLWQNWGKIQRFIIYPCPYICRAAHIIDVPPQSGAFVRISGPTHTHHYHSKSTAYIRVHFGGLYILQVLTKMTHIHHYSAIQSSFTALKIFCVLPGHLSLHLIPSNRPSFCLQILSFSDSHIVGIFSICPKTYLNKN